MKGSCYLILLFLFCYVNSYSQNFVPNGSFEVYSQCPTQISQVEQCTNWIQPSYATPDYFHDCGTVYYIQTPFNQSGFQYPRSGNAYMGIITYSHVGIYRTREYIEIELTTPLINGSCYYFEMYANLANRSIYTSYDVGAYFSDALVDSILSFEHLPFIPQIQNTPGNSFDTLSWTKVSGTYTAQGGEHYLIIGNFYTDSLTHPVIYDSTAFYTNTYLYIDDVSLTVCTGMEEFNKLDINIAPNPFTEKLTITANNNEAYELMLTDVTGRQIIKQNLQGNATVQTGYLNKGIYFATLRKKEKVVTVKVVKK